MTMASRPIRRAGRADLRFFLAVARIRAITKATRELQTVQSNVSVRLTGLEKELGVRLFNRHARGVTLTSAGEQLGGYAKRIVALVDEASHLTGDRAEPAGFLTVGSMETTAGLRLPDLLLAYAEKHPKVELSLRTGTTDELIQAVVDAEIDGAFVAGPVTQPGLVVIQAFTERLVLVGPVGESSIESELRNCPIPRAVVYRAGCSYRHRLERVLHDRGAAAVRIMEFGTLEGILSCVAAGMGFTLFPVDVVAPYVAAGRVRVFELSDGEAHSETVFIHRRGHDLTRAGVLPRPDPGSGIIVDPVASEIRPAPGRAGTRS
jgi:DNA-binding transcriptional LysR family regulator